MPCRLSEDRSVALIDYEYAILVVCSRTGKLAQIKAEASWAQ